MNLLVMSSAGPSCARCGARTSRWKARIGRSILPAQSPARPGFIREQPAARHDILEWSQPILFIIGTNNRVYHDWFNLSTGAPSGWEDQDGILTSGIVAGLIGGGGLQICGVGSD